MVQNALSFIDSSIWNKTSEVLKKPNSINTFKHDLKNITYHNLIKQKINYPIIITITFITIIALLIICLLLS